MHGEPTLTIRSRLRAGPGALLVLCGLALALGSARARADDDAVVTRPGIGCRSSAALAALTLHGGDSRTHRVDPSASDVRIAGEGGCRDLVIGQRLTVLRAFRNTAVVTAEKQPDRGYGVFVVPTIDLGPTANAATRPSLQRSPQLSPQPSEPGGASLAQRDAQAVSAAVGMPLRQITARYPGIRCYQASCDFGPGDTPQPLCPAATRCENLGIFFDHGVVVGFSADLDLDGWLHSLAQTRSALGPPQQETSRPDGAIRMRVNALSWTVAGMEIDYILYSGLDSFGHALHSRTILVAPPDD